MNEWVEFSITGEGHCKQKRQSKQRQGCLKAQSFLVERANSLMPQAVYHRSSMVTSFSIAQSVVNKPPLHLRLAQLEALQMGFQSLTIPGESQEHKIWRGTGSANKVSGRLQRSETSPVGLSPGHYSFIYHLFIQ